MKAITAKKMATATDNRNRENMAALLPVFRYSITTTNRLNNLINQSGIDYFTPCYTAYNKANISLNNQDRIFFALDSAKEKAEEIVRLISYRLNSYQVTMANIDFSVLRYENCIKIVPNGLFEDEVLAKYPKLIEFQELVINADTIISGNFSFPELRISGKIYKMLLKYEIISQKTMDEINTINAGNCQKYLCISRNPIDFLFASTDQSFTSCLNLYSDYNRAYWLSLPAMLLDTNRFICFVTDGKISTKTINNIEFKHFRYQQRNWLFLDSNGNFLLDRNYPANIFNVQTYIEDITGNNSLDFDFAALNRFNTGFFENHETRPLIYLDSLGIDTDNKGNWFYKDGISDSGNNAPDFNYSSGIDNIINISDIEDIMASSNICASCGNRYSDDAGTFHNGEFYCHDCYSDTFTSCDRCGCVCNRDDSYYNDHDDATYCSSCHDDCVECTRCGESFHPDNGVYDREFDTHYCNQCQRQISRL